MRRLLLLCAAAAVVFCGFAAPFLIVGGAGLAVGALLVVLGAGLTVIVERRTVASLDRDTWLNRILNVNEGEND